MRTFRRLSLYVVALGLVALATDQALHVGLSPTQIGVISKVLVAWLAVILARYVQELPERVARHLREYMQGQDDPPHDASSAGF